MRTAGLVSVARPVSAATRLTAFRPRPAILSPCYRSISLSQPRFVHSEQAVGDFGPKRPSSHLSRACGKQDSDPSANPESGKRPKSPVYRRFGFWVLLIGSSATTFYLLKSAGDDDDTSSNELSTLSLLSNRDLVRAYIVYTLCSFPSLIDVAPNFIDWVWNSYIPGNKQLWTLGIRYTFFEQFVGAETLQGSSHVVEKLAKDNIGVLFNYSVEASETSDSAKDSTPTFDPESPLHDGLVKEITESVEHAAQMNEANGLGTSVAFKFSGLLKDPSILLRLSTAIVRKQDFTASGHVALTQPDLWNRLSTVISTADAHALAQLLKALENVGERARAANVKLIIDAEQSWLQPGIDALYLQLARKCNRVDKAERKARRTTSWLPSKATGADAAPYESQPPIFYTTLQCSLRRSAALLEALLEDGRRTGWAVGVKVVRGAYVDQEHAAAELAQTLTPAWSSKDETDRCFNTCAQMLLDDIAHDLSRGRPGAAGAMFASHNRESVTMLLRLLQERGLAKPANNDTIPKTIVTPESSEVSTVAPAAAAAEDPILVMSSAAAQRICFGQLYGMADDITTRLSTHLLTPSRATPAVYKYLPYGPLDRVLPYLVRRAKENKAIMTSDSGGGGANADKERLKAEMWRRVRQWWNDLNGGGPTATTSTSH